MIESYSRIPPLLALKRNRAPILFFLYIIVVAIPFMLVVVWSEGPPLSLSQNVLLYLSSFVFVGVLDYLAINRCWKTDSSEEETRMVLTAWCVQMGPAMQGCLRLVWWKFSGEGVSGKVIVPVTLGVASLRGFLFSTGLSGESRPDGV